MAGKSSKEKKRKSNNKKKSGGLKLAVSIFAVAICIAGLGLLGAVYYTTFSYIQLVGEPHVTVGLHGIYTEQGVTAKIAGIDISERVEPEGHPDVNTPGDYKITYHAGNFTAERTVTVMDRMSPLIELKGGDVSLLLSEEFKEPGYTATDDNGNDISADVKVTEADVSRAGTQKLIYSVTDSEGKTTEVTRNVTVQRNINYATPGLPILMFHYVYDETDPPDDLYHRYGNYIGAQALTEELEWLNSEGYYYPTWQEVRDYVDGKQLLPDKSVVITFDDCVMNFLENGIPVMEKCKVPATSFVITKNSGEKKVKKYASQYIDFESHSNDMHRSGGHVGHGGIFTAISYEEGMADLKKSIEIVGNSNAFAYPYGDFNDASEQMVKDAGFLCAVTTQEGKAKPGDDPYRLPRRRMSLNQTMQTFMNKVQPVQTVSSQ